MVAQTINTRLFVDGELQVVGTSLSPVHASATTTWKGIHFSSTCDGARYRENTLGDGQEYVRGSRIQHLVMENNAGGR